MITQEFVLEKLARRPLINMDQLNADFTQGEYDRSKAKLRDAMSFGKSNSRPLPIAGSVANVASAPTSIPVVKPISNATYAIGRGMNLGSNFSQAYNTHVPEDVRARIALGQKLKELEEWKP